MFGLAATTVRQAWSRSGTSHSHRSGLSRSAIAALVYHNLYEPAQLLDAPEDVLRQWLSTPEIRRLKEWAHEKLGQEQPEQANESSRPASLPPILKVDDRHPSQIAVDGSTVHLQEKQYRLIRLLAQHPGECVDYEKIYEALWGDGVVEAGQMHYQKQQLLKRIKATVPRRFALVKTISKRGFRLCLTSEQIGLYMESRSTVEV